MSGPTRVLSYGSRREDRSRRHRRSANGAPTSVCAIGELEWIRHARLSAGKGVSLVDLSAGGALLDSPVPLRPDSTAARSKSSARASKRPSSSACCGARSAQSDRRDRLSGRVQVHAADRTAGCPTASRAGADARSLRRTGFRAEATRRAGRTRKRQPIARSRYAFFTPCGRCSFGRSDSPWIP